MPDQHPSWQHREQRFSSLYREHYRSIWAYAVRRVESQADAADVVAEVFATAWRRLSEVPEPPADLLWLYGVARRVNAGKRRSATRMRNLITRLQATAGDTIALIEPASDLVVIFDPKTSQVLDEAPTPHGGLIHLPSQMPPWLAPFMYVETGVVGSITATPPGTSKLLSQIPYLHWV